MTGVVYACGAGSHCDRHDVALHGYSCWACHEEWERRSPRVVALIRQQAGDGPLVTPAQIEAARKADAEEVYDGPHEVTVDKAGTAGPVSRLWNALCVEACGWSHFWLPSKAAATEAGAEHSCG